MSRNYNQPSYGVIVVVYAQEDAAPGAVIERSPNGVTGWEEVGYLPSVLRIGDAFVDNLPNDGVTRFYRARHVWKSGAPGNYTNTVAGSPIIINPNLNLDARPWPTEVPLNTAISLDVSGSVSIFADGSYRTRSVRWAITTASLALPDVANGTVYNLNPAIDPTSSTAVTSTNPDGLLGITTIGTNFTASDGDIVRSGVQFFTEEDAGGRLLGTHYEVTRYVVATSSIDIKTAPDYVVRMEDFDSGSIQYRRIILDIDDKTNSLDYVTYTSSAGPVNTLPALSSYVTWSAQTTGTYSGSYVNVVPLSSKHFSIHGQAIYWTDTDNEQRVLQDFYYLDRDTVPEIVLINTSYTDVSASINVTADDDANQLRAQEFSGSSWVNVAFPNPAFTNGTIFSSTRTGSFSTPMYEDQKRKFRVWALNTDTGITGSFNEFEINSKTTIVIPTASAETVRIEYTKQVPPESGLASDLIDSRSIEIGFYMAPEVVALKIENNALDLPTQTLLDSSIILSSSQWTNPTWLSSYPNWQALGGDEYRWVISDNSLNQLNFPNPYGADVRITLTAYTSSTVFDATTQIGRDLETFFDDSVYPGLGFVSPTVGFVSDILQIGSGLSVIQTGSTAQLTFNPSALTNVVSSSIQIDHDQTTNFVADEHVAHGSVSISAGTGLTGGGTIAANRTLSLTGQALALHNLSTNGLIARTGTGTVAGRTITAGTGIIVSNGNGVSGNPTITNDGVTNITAGTGIGVSSPAGALTISNTGVTSNTAGTGISISGTTGASTINHADTSALNGSYGGFGISDITVDSLGHVTNIGTATFVQENGSPTFTDVYVGGHIYHSGDTDTYIRFPAADDFQIVVGNRQVFRCDEGTDPDIIQIGDATTTTEVVMSGSVYIGKETLTSISTFANQKLNVDGNIFMPTGSSLWIGSATDSGSRARVHQFSNNMYLDWGGGVLYFRSGNGAAIERATLDGTGTFTATGDVRVSSDVRLKNVSNIPVMGLDIVKELNPIKYSWKDNRDDGKLHLGFAAQELLEIVPEVVGEDTEGYYSVAYQKLVPVLVKAIQELTKEVEELKKKIGD